MKFAFYTVLFCFFSIVCYSQKAVYTVLSIPDSLKVNANSVVRLDKLDIAIESQRAMTITNKRVVTVFNEKGQNAIDATAYYNKAIHVKSIEATVYDAFGNELKKIKKKDFRDQSLSDGSITDMRVLFLDYTPTQYPFTIIFETEITSSNTAFIPTWQPVSDYFVSIENSLLNVTYPDNLGFSKKEYNLADYRIVKTAETNTHLSYAGTNIAAVKSENYAPESAINPKVLMGLEHFSLEGVDGHAKTWKEFGQWYSEKILSGTTTLPEETKIKMRQLVGDIKDPIEKARIIYDYVQQKSRYVSIQLGIGGWKPMLAKDVDRLGYGDCKALSNYTKALLEAVDVTAYNTVLYGTRYEKKDIDGDMVSMQGNHMTLAIPSGNSYVWLECTSQDIPFGYQANFTDDRDVLIIKPDGGEIVRTKKYDNADNSQISKGTYMLSATGDLTGEVAIVSEGSQYVQKYKLKDDSPVEKEKHYKEYWSNINNLKIEKTAFANDKIKASFTENINISAKGYGSVSGDKMMVVLNAYNQATENIKRIRNRKSPFEVTRGFYDNDEITIALPEGFVLETLPKGSELSSKYGKYKTEIIKKDDNHLVYKRSFSTNKGLYANTEYEDYRLFMEQVARNDNAKMILTKTQ